MRWLEWRRNAHWTREKIALAGLVLFVILKLLILIPVVGWLLVLIPVCAAFGALLAADWLWLRQGDRMVM